VPEAVGSHLYEHSKALKEKIEAKKKQAIDEKE